MLRRVTAALVFLLALSGCLARQPTGPEGGSRQAKLLVRADLAGTMIATVVLEVTAPDIATPLMFNIPIENRVALGTIEAPAGSNRTIALSAFDAGGVKTHAGSATLTIQPNTNPSIAITLMPLTGDLPITVTMGSFSVTVVPAAVTRTQGDTVTLTAAIRDAGNNLVTGQIVWATLASGVATVISTGQQTGRVTTVGPGQTTIVAVYGGVAGPAAITVTPPPGPALLRVSTANPRYFADPTGRVVYLTGSHTWGNFQDVGHTDPPAAFDWTAYLEEMEQHHHNFMKLWRWEQSRWTPESRDSFWYAPLPYMRTGPGTALDGKPKFDVNQFNSAYFDRMRQHIIEAGQHGIYVSIMLFDGWSLNDKDQGQDNPWIGHPFNRNNNINGIDGDPNHDDDGIETQLLLVPALVALQEAYVRQVVDAVNDLDNVLYEISNEPNGVTGETEWQYHMIQFIKDYEAAKPKQHPVGMTVFSPGGSNVELFASPADWIAPNGSGTVPFDPLGNPAVADGSKVIIDDTDHLCGVCGNRQWVWKSFTRGRNPVFMDPYDGAIPVTSAPYDPADPRWPQIRVNLGYARTFADRLNLAAMTPRGDLATSGFCLAHVGVEYLVYLPTAGTVTVNLSADPGPFTVEWFNPQTGLTTLAGTTPGGASQLFTAPFTGDAVLYLHK